MGYRSPPTLQSHYHASISVWVGKSSIFSLHIYFYNSVFNIYILLEPTFLTYCVIGVFCSPKKKL
jgi:hypothetical protein